MSELMEYALAPPTIGLRPYQARAVSRVFGEFESGKRSTVLVMATGTGKTVTFGYVARYAIEQGGRVLILAHRGELLTQAADQLASLGIECAIEKAEQNARGCLWGDAPCVVASVQTMKGDRLRSWEPGSFKLIITDEAHHATAGSYRRIYEHLRPEWHLGVTATPDRLDGDNLGRVYQSVADEYSIRQAIKDGMLSRLRVVRCETSVDLSDIRTTGRDDFSLGDIEAAIAPHVEELVNATKQEIGHRRAIVFTPDVGSGEAFASGLQAVGIAAESISGKSRDRDEILSGFRSGRFRVLVNCQLLTEGFDAPFVSAIVLARPTKSRALYSQMVGRGTRPFLGKENCLIVDFSWITGRHKLVASTELFDTTDEPQEVQDIARDLIEKGETDDLMEAIEKAEETHKERVKLRVQVRERQARYRRVSYDPFSVMEVLGVAVRGESDASMKNKATPKQVAFLEKLGVAGASEMSKRRATLMLDRIMDRMRGGLATVKQVSWLIAKGIDPDEARALTKGEASERLDELFGNRRAV